MKQGIGLSGALFLVFLVLKLAEIGQVATWSWWWVTCPLWIGLAIAIVFLVIALLIASVASAGKPKNYAPRESKFQKRLREAQEARKAQR